MNKLLLKKEITFPPATEYASMKNAFMAVTGFPGVIRALDCTHVAIIAPPEPSEDCYINRKGYHSINVQLVNILYTILFNSKKSFNMKCMLTYSHLFIVSVRIPSNENTFYHLRISFLHVNN